MVPGDKVLKGSATPYIFMTFGGGSKMEKNMKIRTVAKPLKTHDHAQMIERKKLYQVALTKPLYDQTRPQFSFRGFQFDDFWPQGDRISRVLQKVAGGGRERMGSKSETYF